MRIIPRELRSRHGGLCRSAAGRMRPGLRGPLLRLCRTTPVILGLALAGCDAPPPPPPIWPGAYTVPPVFIPPPAPYIPPIHDVPPTADNPPSGGLVSLPSPARPRPEPEPAPEPSPESAPAASVAPFRYVMPIAPVPMDSPAVTDKCVGYWRLCHFLW